MEQVIRDVPLLGATHRLPSSVLMWIRMSFVVVVDIFFSFALDVETQNFVQRKWLPISYGVIFFTVLSPVW